MNMTRLILEKVLLVQIRPKTPDVTLKIRLDDCFNVSFFLTERESSMPLKLPLLQPAPCHPASVLPGVRSPPTWLLETL